MKIMVEKIILSMSIIVIKIIYIKMKIFCSIKMILRQGLKQVTVRGDMA